MNLVGELLKWTGGALMAMDVSGMSLNIFWV